MRGRADAGYNFGGRLHPQISYVINYLAEDKQLQPLRYVGFDYPADGHATNQERGGFRTVVFILMRSVTRLLISLIFRVSCSSLPLLTDCFTGFDAILCLMSPAAKQCCQPAADVGCMSMRFVEWPVFHKNTSI